MHIRCPHCRRYLAEIRVDGKAHVRIVCGKCGEKPIFVVQGGPDKEELMRIKPETSIRLPAEPTETNPAQISVAA